VSAIASGFSPPGLQSLPGSGRFRSTQGPQFSVGATSLAAALIGLPGRYVFARLAF